MTMAGHTLGMKRVHGSRTTDVGRTFQFDLHVHFTWEDIYAGTCDV